MVNKGDNVTILTTNSGEKIVLPVCQNISKGDNVLRLPTADGQIQTQSNAPIGIGDVVINLTSPHGEKLAINVSCGKEKTECEYDVYQYTKILTPGYNSLGDCPGNGYFRRACSIEIHISEKLGLFMFPNPCLGNPYCIEGYPRLEYYITNISPAIFYTNVNIEEENPKSSGFLQVGGFYKDGQATTWVEFIGGALPGYPNIWDLGNFNVDRTIGRPIVSAIIDHEDYPEIEQGVPGYFYYEPGLSDNAVAIITLHRKLDLTDTTDEGCNE
ncbi:hypothetical protein [Methanobacterium spitsbergense]|uniref:Uncharacterized protein n=1 Tax=Methanobacterium spitsbergense TaxID=2874285 RepID=A0A8T5UVK9_9EURY|nr:hypothetical protein [Methanobacterium spitsbergense]MBZ2166287.1 hypothetical protein [Methanobacterium spitsbergense]